jgi:hypothetical protein
MVHSSGKLGPWPDEAEAYAKRLGNVLVPRRGRRILYTSI